MSPGTIDKLNAKDRATLAEPRPTDTPQIDVTREGAIVFTARSNPQPALGILYPDMNKMTTFAAYR